ncbi:uncharacterized protein LOC127117317 isoform X2 [Lathyrus oleraceus]|uniref:uncharacterized protein LOC127117317 isoform X2 n=1 Tax=Pisum sativum TaxID=3888 RepID=UPI0021CFE008|nr:uncharacterized protein LOC127117317 isoform X2 [Pisum sativum]
MGNSLNGASLFNDVTNYPCRIQLGRYAFIDVTYTENKHDCSDSDDEVPIDNDDEFPRDEDEVIKVTKMLYTVDRSSICELKFERSHKEASLSLHDVDNGSNSNGVDVKIIIRNTDEGYLEIPFPVFFARGGGMYIFNWDNNSNRTINAWGGVTELTTFLFGKGKRGSLVVIESKKKSISDPNPYMVTVVHYLAIDDGNFFNAKMDIGLSVMVKIQPSDDLGLKFTVEGPEKHPSSSLLYMFERVKRLNGAWKPNLCPHCANLRLKSLQMFESEDSDYFPRRHGNGYKQKSESMVASDSHVKGNYNSSLLGKYFHFYKK